jgi:TatD DNase family protein
MPYIDTHAHLDDEQFDADRSDVLARARDEGIDAIICPAITADSSEAVVELAQTNTEIYAAVGIQPNYCAEAGPDDWERILQMASSPRVAAIGETGLDWHWDFTPFEMQKDYFDRHLRLSQERNLPVIIHCREAEDDVLATLREAAARGPIAGVMHAFSGDRAFAGQCLELGLYVSFAGAVTYRNKKFGPLWEAAREIPDDRILLETDSPYLVPHPLRGKQKRNEPRQVLHTAARLAELRGVSIEQLAAQTTANARRLFRLP